MNNDDPHTLTRYENNLGEEISKKKFGISVEFVTDLESAYYISFIVRNVECVCLYGSGKDTI